MQQTLQDKSVEELGEDNGGSDGGAEAADQVAALSLAALSSGGQAQAVRIRHVYFNLATEPYQHLYTRLETLLKAPSNPPYHPRDIDGRYVLGPRRSVFKGAPLGWIMLHVTAGPEPGPANIATLALAEDDLYIFGFANGSNHWYFVKNFASGVRGATTLPFAESYVTIIDGGHKAGSCLS
ncbi:ribosome inactivating protein precursor [Panicum miliaceum]|uniref:rRNA N-glycosylase n=1 Tax=Panicum miliaceum TaxID=4540 RepID=A0A3L6QCL0_PANMI|nr:ribosome inactivating protein precursor [Panicum miliaceum]